MDVKNDWNESLYGCFDDCGICCYGYWCVCCLFGRNSEKANKKSCPLMCCLYAVAASFSLCWIPHMFEREKIRAKYNLKEDPCGDCPVTLCCSPCAVCQEAREMKSREKQQGVAYNANPSGPVVSQPGQNSNNPPPVNVRV